MSFFNDLSVTNKTSLLYHQSQETTALLSLPKIIFKNTFEKNFYFWQALWSCLIPGYNSKDNHNIDIFWVINYYSQIKVA